MRVRRAAGRRSRFSPARGVLGIAFLTLGCGQGVDVPDQLKGLAPVTGRVTFKGDPAAGAELLFFPADAASDAAGKGPVTKGSVAPDGALFVQTIVPQGTGEGAPPGQYAVTVSWKKPLRPDDRDTDFGPELLPKRYQDRKNSGLNVEIKPGKNDLQPFELTP